MSDVAIFVGWGVAMLLILVVIGWVTIITTASHSPWRCTRCWHRKIDHGVVGCTVYECECSQLFFRRW